jgi:C1A family cysteine protease
LVQVLSQLKGCIADGYPFVFGFTVYDSFESPEVAKTGIVPMPSAKDTAIGGHAVLAVGYDDKEERFIVRNSWGPGWGMKGYFTIPYSYVTNSNLADDLWTIRMVA